MKSDLLKHTEIFVFLAMVFSIFTAILLTDKKGLSDKNDRYVITISGLQKELYVTSKELESSKKKIDTLISKIQYVEDSLTNYVNQTLPHIVLNGSENYSFEKGKSVITPNFKSYLNNYLVPELLNKLEQCKGCNSIYIVGHTDGENATNGKNEKFDNDGVDAINNPEIPITFGFNSNMDLGFQRALSVCLFLKNHDSLKGKIEYWFPYSAGPFIDPDSSYLINYLDKEGDAKKRRIELWLYAYQPKNED